LKDYYSIFWVGFEKIFFGGGAETLGGDPSSLI
jgi:hypothetical protein